MCRFDIRNAVSAPGAAASASVVRCAVASSGTQAAAGRRRVRYSASPSRAASARHSPAAVQGSDAGGEYAGDGMLCNGNKCFSQGYRI